jgi:small subunit ribosomal protein S14
MTYSNHNKVYAQLKNKVAKWNKFLKHNAPKDRSTGKVKHSCTLCGRIGGHIQKYNLHLCRQCFRDSARRLGFKKYQ